MLCCAEVSIHAAVSKENIYKGNKIHEATYFESPYNDVDFFIFPSFLESCFSLCFTYPRCSFSCKKRVKRDKRKACKRDPSLCVCESGNGSKVFSMVYLFLCSWCF